MGIAPLNITDALSRGADGRLSAVPRKLSLEGLAHNLDPTTTCTDLSIVSHLLTLGRATVGEVHHQERLLTSARDFRLDACSGREQ